MEKTWRLLKWRKPGTLEEIGEDEELWRNWRKRGTLENARMRRNSQVGLERRIFKSWRTWQVLVVDSKVAELERLFRG